MKSNSSILMGDVVHATIGTTVLFPIRKPKATNYYRLDAETSNLLPVSDCRHFSLHLRNGRSVIETTVT